ncbi:MAG: YmdB family metallophosphoesterase [Candidatus Eisenbacteria bacterium]|nr:YmdB family metallophosphoesterase [Candidatus Eisenbacteria bacterium]
MRILFIGDVVGRPGRRAVELLLPGLVREWGPSLVVANGENAAGGIGLTKPVANDLFALGIDVLTSGNHIWDKKGAAELVAGCERILRPANYPPGTPGRGAGVFETAKGVPVGVVNLQGRVFLPETDCPFRVGAALVAELRTRARVVLVDLHAEATSEKVAMAWHLAGAATAVLGTHTHVQTADERIVDGFTAAISDAGMTGPYDSVIGMRRDLSLARFLTQIPQRFEPAGGRLVLCGVVVDADETSGAATGIHRVMSVIDG